MSGLFSLEMLNSIITNTLIDHLLKHFCYPKNRYIILKGSVNVVILGKGIVCTLNDGDDFGKLAVINETVRAATIVTNEDNCQFLTVSKYYFDKIMRDAEQNTVRLKEHGNEVLVLQKMATRVDDDQEVEGQSARTGFKTGFKYMVSPVLHFNFIANFSIKTN